jgi:hypothetical protein
MTKEEILDNGTPDYCSIVEAAKLHQQHIVSITDVRDAASNALDFYAKQQCIAFIEWGFKDDNPFVEGSNGRWIQQCGNSTSWSSEQLYEIFTKQTKNK